MKKPLRILLKTAIVVMAALCLATFAFADEEVAGADFNDGAMHWSISADGVLTISGTGDTPDYGNGSNAPWYAYRNQISSIVVEEGITGLGNYAFSELNNVVDINLPNSLTALGEYCFYTCSALTEIDLPDNLEMLSEFLFYGCSKLTSIAIPEGIVTIPDGVFGNCISLTEITFPSSISEFNGGWQSFENTAISDIYFAGSLIQWLKIDCISSDAIPMKQPCNLYIGGEKLTNLTIPESITSIPSYAFQYVNLNSVTIPSNVTRVGQRSFSFSSVQSVRMADSVTNVGNYAFGYCDSLERVYFVGNQSKWSSIAWNSGNDALIDAPRYYIDSFDDIRSVTVTAAEHGTISVSDAYCIPGDVITVIASPEPGYRLKSILVNGSPIDGSSFTAEAGVDYVVTAEFEFYRGVIDSGTCGAALSWILYDNNVLYIYGSGDMYDYRYNILNPPWYNYRRIIESIIVDEGVTSLGQNAFADLSALTSVELPDSLRRIGSYALSGCESLTSISFPAGIESIEGYVFGSTLDALYYEGNIENWLDIEFKNSRGILGWVEKLYISGDAVENLVIPNGISSIPQYAFSYYYGLKSVVFPASLTSIGDGAFVGCDKCVYAEFLGNAPSIGVNTFSASDNFVIYYHSSAHGWSSPKWDVYYAACVEEFSDYSALDADNRNSQGVLFTLNDTAMTAIVGDGSSEYNNSGYYGAQKGAVKIPDVVTKGGKIYTVIGVGNNAFAHNKHVTSVSIGSGVTSIIPSAFMGCPALESINVSEGNEYYSSDGGVLYDAEKLYLYVYPGGKADESFTVPETVRTVGMYSFYDNEHIRLLYVGANVTSVYEYAFCGLSNLAEITLPFIGTGSESAEDYVYFYDIFGDGYAGDNCLGEWDVSIIENVRIRAGGSLKKVTILGGGLYQNSFSSCGSIEEINLPGVPDSIPSGCFNGCVSLNKVTFAGNSCRAGEIILPEGIKSIEANAFTSCHAITRVTIPASIASIERGAFSSSGLEAFAVADGNPNYSTDEWGVLYNKDKTSLIQYPACRQWPYYNVAATATKIERQAFSGSNTLVNLYIPNTVTAFAEQYYTDAIVNCPNLTVCCFSDSAAARYARTKGLTAWYMDNKTLQGIRVYSLPEQAVQTEGAVDFSGLYIVGDYGGKELQIDNYTLRYDDSSSGLKTVTVEYMGKTVTFEMIFYTSEAGNVISFRTDEDLDGKVAMIVVYNSEGAMLLTANAAIINGEAQIGVSDEVFAAADHAKLLILDESTYAPAAAAQETSV